MSDVNSYRAIISGSVVFQGVAPPALDKVLAVSQIITCKPGELVLSEGTPGDGLYIVLEGEIEVFLPQLGGAGARRATTVRLARVGPGRCLGEYGVIDDRPSSASVRALSAAKLCFLPKAKFRALAEADDHLGRVVYANLLRYLVGRLRSKDKELDIVLLADNPRP